MKLTKNFSIGCLLLMVSLTGFAQDAKIKLGKANIGLNQYFTITITVENDRLKNYNEFPDIDGFIKRGTSSSSSTSFVNGQMTSSQSLTQNYQASEKGTFLLAPFSITINGNEVQSEGTQIVVGASKKVPFSDA